MIALSRTPLSLERLHWFTTRNFYWTSQLLKDRRIFLSHSVPPVSDIHIQKNLLKDRRVPAPHSIPPVTDSNIVGRIFISQIRQTMPTTRIEEQEEIKRMSCVTSRIRILMNLLQVQSKRGKEPR